MLMIYWMKPLMIHRWYTTDKFEVYILSLKVVKVFILIQPPPPQYSKKTHLRIPLLSLLLDMFDLLMETLLHLSYISLNHGPFLSKPLYMNTWMKSQWDLPTHMLPKFICFCTPHASKSSSLLCPTLASHQRSRP